MEREQSTTSLPQLLAGSTTSWKAQRTDTATDAASAARSTTPTNSNGVAAAAPSTTRATKSAASSEVVSVASTAGTRNEDDDGDSEVAGGKRKSSKAKSSGKKGRSGNYNEYELLFLAKAFAGVSNNAAVGTDQSKPAMLEQAAHRFQGCFS